MMDKKVEAPKVDTKPMAAGAPKVEDKKMDAPKTAAQPAIPAPADVKKQ